MCSLIGVIYPSKIGKWEAEAILMLWNGTPVLREISKRNSNTVVCSEIVSRTGKVVCISFLPYGVTSHAMNCTSWNAKFEFWPG